MVFPFNFQLDDFFQLSTFNSPGGETGIRTPETLLAFTRFPGVPLQPLEHLSFALFTALFVKIGCKVTTFFLNMQIFCKKKIKKCRFCEKPALFSKLYTVHRTLSDFCTLCIIHLTITDDEQLPVANHLLNSDF